MSLFDSDILNKSEIFYIFFVIYIFCMSSILYVFYSAPMDDSSLLFLYICFSVSPFFCFSVFFCICHMYYVIWSYDIRSIHDLEPSLFLILCFLFLLPSALAFILFFCICVSLSLLSEFYFMLFCLSASLSLSLFVIRFTCSLAITILHKHKTF